VWSGKEELLWDAQFNQAAGQMRVNAQIGFEANWLRGSKPFLCCGV
jgi:hypothetical protein